jgi:hypothetical protein
MRRFFGTGLFLIAGLLVCAPGYAQMMFRCGNKYQDRPCDAGQKGQAVGSSGVGAAAGAAPAGDAQCAQRGKDSLQIVWSREGGATEETLMSAARTGSEQRLVRDVYRRRGAASQIQAAVEADCIAEKQKEAEANALAIAASRARGDLREMRGEGAESSPSMPTSQPADPRAAEQAKQAQAAQAADQKKRICADLNSQMDRLTAREREGGTVRTMDALRADRRRLQTSLSNTGC